MIMRILGSLMLAVLCTVSTMAFAQGKGGAIDFTSSIGRETTCQRYATLELKRLARNEAA